MLYTFLSFDDGIRQKLCSRMLYEIACGTRGWVYISSHGVGYDIPSLSERHCVGSVSRFSAELQDAMADDESESCEGAAMTQDQFAFLMGPSAPRRREWRRDSPSFALRFDLGKRTQQRRLLSGNDMKSPMRATKIKRRSMPKWTRVVVQEYTADELAEDSGDEKRLEKAERAAELKAAKRRKKKASSAQSSRSRSA